VHHRAFEDPISDELAGILLAPPIETVDDVRSLRTTENRPLWRERLTAVHEALGRYITQATIQEYQHDPATAQAVLHGRLDETQPWSETKAEQQGVYIPDMHWVDDMLAQITGNKPVEIDISTPGVTSEANMARLMRGQPGKYPTELSIARMADALGRTVASTRSVVTVNDHANGKRLRDELPGGYSLARQYGGALYDGGVLRPGDIGGHDFRTVSLRQASARVDELVCRLQASGNGQLLHEPGFDGNSAVSFAPDQWLADMAGVRSAIPIISRKGEVCENAARVAAYLDDVHSQYSRLSIRPVSNPEREYRSQSAKEFALLRALDITHPDQHLTVGYRHATYDPGVVIAQVLRSRLAGMIDRIDQHLPYEKMSVYDYAIGNYGYEQVIPEDIATIEWELEYRDLIAECMGVDLNNPETLLGDNEILHPGLGPNLFPVMLSQVFTNGRIDGREFTALGRQYIDELKRGTIRPPHDMLWNKFQDCMVNSKHGGARYADAIDRAKEKLDVSYGDIFDITPGAYRMIHMDFVAESVVPYRQPFCDAMRSVANGLRPTGSVLVARFMKGSDGWDGHDATPVDEDLVRKVCADVGLEVLVLKDASEKLAPEQKLRPEDSMLFLIARPRQRHYDLVA
jgi:hypothetical protein